MNQTRIMVFPCTIQMPERRVQVACFPAEYGQLHGRERLRLTRFTLKDEMWKDSPGA